MAMTDTERILAYLRSVSPRAATNSEIPVSYTHLTLPTILLV